MKSNLRSSNILLNYQTTRQQHLLLTAASVFLTAKKIALATLVLLFTFFSAALAQSPGGPYGPVCNTAGAITLNGSPSGGVWSCDTVGAIVGNTFVPSVFLATGDKEITYTENGNSVNTTIHVDVPFTPSAGGSPGVICPLEEVSLTGNFSTNIGGSGYWTTSGGGSFYENTNMTINNAWDPAGNYYHSALADVNTTVTITLNTNNGACPSTSSSFNVFVNPEPVLTVTNSPFNVCPNAPASINITRTVTGNIPGATYDLIYDDGIVPEPAGFTNILGDPYTNATTLSINLTGAPVGSYPFLLQIYNGSCSSDPAYFIVTTYGVTNTTSGISYATIQAAINAAIAGDVIEVCAGTYAENVIVNKALSIRGANYGVAGCGARGAESTVAGGAGAAFTITANGVTIDGFEITGVTGVASSGVSNIGIRNNKFSVAAIGINAGTISTSGGSTYTIEDNCIDLLSQVVAGPTATIGILINGATGSAGLFVDDNTTTDAFYGYVINGVNTSPVSVFSDGIITGVMQGVAIVNTVGGPLAASNVSVSGMNMSAFAGVQPTLPAQNFHAGVYTFTAGTSIPANGITLAVNNCTINGTQSLTPAGAGIYLGDFSTGTVSVQTVTVNECNILNNTNRGIDARGRVTATVTNSTFTNNGSAAFSSGGNNGFTMIAQQGANITASNNFIVHPASSTTPVTAFLTGNTPASPPNNTITATNNSVLMNGNTVNGRGADNTSGNTLSATCNWWGTGVAANVTPLMSGVVTYTPYLTTGVDNAPAAGFQPVPNSCNGCLTGVTNTTTLITYCSIQAAIDAPQTLNGHTLAVDAGTYNEQVLVNKEVTIKNASNVRPTIDFTGTVTGKPTLFDISADNVTIDSIRFNVDLSKLRSAIIASAAGIDNIVVVDNLIDAYGTPAGSYGDRNAVSINYSGTTNYRVATGGVNSVTFQGNTVNGSLPSSFFRSGISLDEGGGTFSGNTLQTINHDILVRFAGNGAVNITGNNSNGGGIELSDQNAAAGTMTVSNNIFTGVGAPNTAMLRVKNNYNSIAHVISSNTFNSYEWGISLENMNSVTLNGNTFNTASATAHAVTVNTKSISSNSSSIVQVPVSATLTNNNFNGTGNALTFLNHDSDNDSYGTFTLGTVGNENNFASTLTSFIVFDNQTAISNLSTFPTYPNTVGWNTTMACWDQDLNAQNNKFDVGAGLQLPVAMNNAGKIALEGKLTHDPDNTCLGYITFFYPVHNLTQNTFFLTIGASIAAANPNDVIECAEWTFNERVTIDKSLTLQGVDSANCIINGTGLIGNGNGITINNGITNVTIKKFKVTNFTGASGNANAGIYGIGGNNDLLVEDVGIINNSGGSGFYANGPVTNVTINRVTSTGHLVGARGIVIWNGLKSNITITNCHVYGNNCCGIELQDGQATGVTMTGNNVHDNGDSGLGLMGLQGPGANLIQGNAITNNGRFGIEVKNPNGNGTNAGAGSVVINNNTVSRTLPIVDARDIAGIAVFRRGVGAGNVDVPYGAYVSNNNVSGYTQPSTSEGFGIVMEGINHTVSANTVNGCDIGIQRQAGHLPYPGDGNQNDLADSYFGRGNAPYTCGVTITGSIYGNVLANGINTRDVGNVNGVNIVTNVNTGEPFCTIQQAIDDAQTFNTHVISAPAGTYVENVTVNKSLTINGAQAGVDPRPSSTTPRAGGESVILSPVINISASGSDLFTIAANNVVVDGFTFNGNNPSLSGGISINGTDIQAARAFSNLQPATAVNNLTVKNNIIMNLYRQGVYFYTSSFASQQNNLVEKNVFDNIHRLTADGTATGVYMENEATADVKNNKMTRIGRGIMTATLGSVVTVPFQFSNNEITSYWTGIWVNNHHSAAPVCTVANNTINSEASSTNDGMRITSMFVANELVVSNNTINALRYGYRVWNVPSNTISILGGSVTGAPQGVYASNYYPGFGNASSSTFTIDNVSIQNSTNQGIYIDDDALNTNGATLGAEIKNTTINGSAAATGILVKGSDAYGNIHDNSATITGMLIGVDIDGGTASITTTKITANGTGVRVKNSGALTSTTNNFITNNTADGISIEASAGAIGAITNNDLSGNTLKAINNASAPTIAATCNWYGSILLATVNGEVSGPLTYIPYLNVGTDVGGNPADGFQPDPLACVGVPVVLTCAANQTEVACQTQTAIDNAYAAWLLTATATGCDAVLTNAVTGGTAPLACGSTTTVTWTATSDCETKTCSAVFTVAAGAPVISCPANLTVTCNDTTPAATGFATATGGCGAKTFTYTNVLSSWNASVNSCDHYSYVITRTWTATDACGNTSSCVQTINVVDINGPVVTTPAANASAQCDGTNTALLAWIGNRGGAVATDDCGSSIVWLNDYDPGNFVPGCGATGTVTVEFTPRDRCFNFGTSTIATFTYTDNVPPVMTGCPAPTLVLNCGDALPLVPIVTANDACTGAAVVNYTQTNNGPQACPTSMVYTRTWTTADACGNTTMCQQVISFNPDVTAPVITSCPTALVLNCGDPLPSTAGLAFTDGCSGPGTTPAAVVVDNNPVCISGRVVTYTWTATDACGNTSNCVRTITFNPDVTAPVITPGSIGSCYATSALAEAAALAATTAVDGCSGSVTYAASTSGTCSAVVTVTATDVCGNQSSTTYNTRIDNAAPVITTGTIASCYATAGDAEAAALAATTAVDGCPGTVAYAASTVGTCSAVVTVTATDVCGNQSSTTYNTRIDNTAPVITTGTIASCYATAGDAEAAALAATTAVDGCSGTVAYAASTVGTCSAVVTVTATDVCGNQSSTTYNTRIDNTAPVITTGTIASCYATAGDAEAAALAATTAVDGCPGTVAYAASTVGTCSAVVTVTATDVCGNQSSTTYNTRIDNAAPVITTGTIASCYATAGDAEAAALAATTAVDGCPGTVAYAASTVGTCSAVVTVTATDVCGNQSSTTYNTRIDNTAPVITTGTIASCYATAGDAEAAALAATTAVDGCPGTVAYAASTVGTCSAVVTVTATDVCGNQSSTTYNTRIDNTAPVITTGTIASCYATAGDAEAAALAATTAVDGCPGTVAYVASTVGTCSAVVTVTATDVCGNQSSTTYNTRIDNTAPVITTGTIASCYATAGDAEAAALAATTAVDGCPGTVAYAASTVGTCSAVVTVTATDVCGNQSSTTYNTRIDNTAPVITTGTIASCYATAGDAEAAALAATTAVDGCPGTVAYVASTVGTCSAVVTVTATDVCGNQSSTTYNTRIDNTAPVITTGTIASCYATAGDAEAAALAATTAVDGCPGTVAYAASTVGTCSAVVTVTATDVCGNQSSTTYNTRIDNTAPVITTGTIASCYATAGDAEAAALAATTAVDGCPGTVAYAASTVGTCSAVVTVTATDVCGNQSSTTYNTRIDNTAPVITTGTIASCYATAGDAEAAALAATTAVDGCPGTVAYVASTVGTCSAVVTVTATDVCGNQSSTTYNTRIDNTAPVITTGTIASCYATAGDAEAAALAATTAVDGCPGTVAYAASTVGTCSAVVTVTATDVCGNQSSTTYNTRIDNTAPVITTGTIASCYATAGDAEAAALAATTAVDGCPGTVAYAASTVGTCSAVVTVTATDVCGNQSSTTYNTRIDNTAPVITTGTIASCYATAGDAEAAALAATTAVDGCSGSVTYAASTSGTCSAVVTVTATDVCGNQSSTTYNTRIDNTAPVITTGTIASCYATAGDAEAAALAATTAVDGCPGTVAYAASTVGTCSAVVTVTATDVCGNQSSTTYNTRIDNTAPVITTGTIASCYATAGDAEAAALAATTAVDGCSGTVAYAASTVGTCSAVVTVTATDVCGNQSSTTYNTRIDNTAPVITTGTIASCYATAGDAEAAALAATTAVDGCPGTVAYAASTVGTCSAVVTVTATDVCGNQSSTTYNTRIDNAAPVITTGTIASCYATAGDAEAAALAATTAVDGCPGTVAYAASTVGTCSAVVTVTATDVCGNQSSTTYNTRIDNAAPVITTGTIASCYATAGDAEAAALAATTAVDGCPGTVAYAASTVGTCSAVVTVTATDVCGNQSSTTYNTRIDNAAPVITTGTIASCYATAGDAEAAALAATTAVDGCPGTVAYAASTVGTCSAVVTVTATDVCGNQSSTTYNTRIDNTAPVITTGTIASCYATAGDAEAAALAATTAVDGCPGTVAYAASTVGTCSAVVTVTATDVCGNQSSTTYNTRIDNAAPVITTGTIASCYATAGDAEAAALAATTAVDGCPGTVAYAASTVGTCSAVVTVTATDVCGNQSSTTYNTRIDNAAPVITTGTIASCYATAGDAEAAALAATTAVDGCPGTVAYAASTVGTCSAVVTVTATDVCGNQSSTTYNTRIDNTAPVITTGTIASCYATAGDAEAAALAATTAVDGCPGTVAYAASTVGTCSAVVTVTATDVCGNQSSTTYNTRIDNAAPVITTGTIASCYATAGDAEAAALAATTAVDGCPGTVAYAASTVGTCSAVVTVTATDVCGNQSSTTYNTRIDNTAPVIGGSIPVTPVTGCLASNAPVAVTTVAALETLGLSILDGCTADIDLVVTSSQTSAGTCPIVVTRTYTVTDECGNASTYVQTINVVEPVLSITCPIVKVEAACQTQPAIQASYDAWLLTVAATGGCNTVVTNNAPLTAPNKCGGTVTVVFTATSTCDIKTCSSTFTVTAGAPISIPSSKVNVLCKGNNTGSINTNPAGGCPPYQYLWNDGFTTQNRTNLYSGNYTVTVSDGCQSFTKTITITQPTTGILLTGTKKNPKCNTGATGTATVTVSGGVGPYTYAWSTFPVQTTNMATGLAAGIYSVTVTDASNGCTRSMLFTLVAPSPVTVALTATNPANFACNNGQIVALAAGGTPNAGPTYNYLWSNSKTTATVTGLSATTYTVKVTDKNGCTVTASATLTCTPTKVAADKEPLVSVNVLPNPSNGLFNVRAIAIAPSNATLELMDLTGRIVIMEEMQLIAGNNAMMLDAQAFPKGIYVLRFTVDHKTETIRLVIQ